MYRLWNLFNQGCLIMKAEEMAEAARYLFYSIGNVQMTMQRSERVLGLAAAQRDITVIVRNFLISSLIARNLRCKL